MCQTLNTRTPRTFVAKSLGYDNPANAINTHCKKINKITLSPDLGGREISSKMPPVVMNIIPESDVYRLVMRSNLPNAVAFQDWVCEEVLPAIRKTGEYSTTLPDFTNPAEAARAWADEYEKNLALTAANQQLTEEKEMLEIVIGNAREWQAGSGGHFATVGRGVWEGTLQCAS